MERKICLFLILSVLSICAMAQTGIPIIDDASKPVSEKETMPTAKKVWVASMFLVGASAAADIKSSYGLWEQNPILGRGQFGNKKAALVSGLEAGAIGTQIALCHKYHCNKKDYIAIAVINGVAVGLHTYAAIHNYNLPGR